MVDQKGSSLHEAIELLYFAYRAFTDGPDRILERRGLGRVHHRILYFVGGRPGLSVKTLLRLLAVTKQAVNTPLRQLVEMKLIAAAPDEGDRRIKRLRLTEAGRRLEAELTRVQSRLLADAFRRSGADQAEGWRTVMRRLAAAAKPPETPDL
jgi:DNA-binding MarR family transcriptional regulator